MQSTVSLLREVLPRPGQAWGGNHCYHIFTIITVTGWMGKEREKNMAGHARSGNSLPYHGITLLVEAVGKEFFYGLASSIA